MRIIGKDDKKAHKQLRDLRKKGGRGKLWQSKQDKD